ncbi:hypothetical protein E0500_015025 [Streptomyces sp. KM273126]|uniref:hypothetical protein n=1 Tax=Streptomyces sp. KM273126 TaxID=2545247 RepID=UPI00103CCFCA|nr:hypothetical protein [Streptomyces sp. KM273126]MBA2808674.1 hypothetical protein [Streptomyces sp. KM273126]
MPVEHHEDPFEHRLGDALRQAGGAFEADGAALVAGGEVRGRRLLRRRRATVAGGVAGVALAGVGGALLVPWGGGGDGESVAAAAPTPKPSASASVSASPTPARQPMSGDELLRTLKRLLPEGKFSREDSRGTGAEFGPYAQLVYDDGKGAAAIGISMGRIEPGSQQARQVTTCPAEELIPHDACSTSRLPDGSLLMLFQGYEYPDRRVDTKRWNAELVSPEGHHVSLTEWNAEAEEDAPVTRPDPPLSTEQLKKVVTAKDWRTAVDAIPEKPEGPKEPTASAEPPAADGQAIQKTLISLLPKDVKVVSKGDQEGEYGFVVVDDGKGATFVQINVQPGMSDVESELFGPDAEVLPDGTKVTTRQGPGDDKGMGLVMWTVDTIRTDGLRVVVMAFNSRSQLTAPTRDTPALTMGDLRKIATSEQWEQLLQAD